jgi:hypothetical protein
MRAKISRGSHFRLTTLLPSPVRILFVTGLPFVIGSSDGCNIQDSVSGQPFAMRCSYNPDGKLIRMPLPWLSQPYEYPASSSK